MSHIDPIKTTEISCINPVKETAEISWTNPYEMTFYFFVPEQVFFEIAPILGSYDAFLHAKGQEIGLAASLIVQAAWAFVGGPEAAAKLSGGGLSISMSMIEEIFENEYSELINVFNQAKSNCSKYQYPRSSWELIHQTTWRYFPGRPCLVNSSWTFQGTNDPYTEYVE